MPQGLFLEKALQFVLYAQQENILVINQINAMIVQKEHFQPLNQKLVKNALLENLLNIKVQHLVHNVQRGHFLNQVGLIVYNAQLELILW